MAVLARLELRQRAAAAVARFGLGAQFWGWADQAVVSVAAFVTLILVARWAGAAELGLYGVSLSLLALAIAVQDALILRPYNIVHAPAGRGAAPDAGAAACSSLLLAALFASLAILGGLASGFHGCGVALAVAAGGALLRDFARRFATIHGEVRSAFMLDLAVAAATSLAVITLGQADLLSAATALLATGAACGASAAGWFCRMRRLFAFPNGRFIEAISSAWRTGGWLLASQLVVFSQAYLTHWMSFLVGGAETAGQYVAVLSLVALSNPLVFGFSNVFGARSSRALALGGLERLYRETIEGALLLIVPLAAFTAALLIFGGWAMTLLYPGSAFQSEGLVLTLLAIAVCIGASGMPAAISLASAGRSSLVTAIVACTALVDLAAVW